MLYDYFALRIWDFIFRITALVRQDVQEVMYTMVGLRCLALAKIYGVRWQYLRLQQLFRFISILLLSPHPLITTTYAIENEQFSS